MTKTFSAPENLQYWRAMGQQKTLHKFKDWARRGEPVSLFRGMSEVVLTLLFHLNLGDEFADKYVEELVPLVRDYESAIQKLQTKLFPRWMTGKGRLLSHVEHRITVLVEEEVK